MNFRGLFVFIILQLYQDAEVSAFDRNALKNYLREKETVTNATIEINPQIEIFLQNFRTKIITQVKEEFETVSKDVKSYQKRSLIATSEYLTKVIADEIKPIKEFLISLNDVKNIFQEKLTAKVKSSIKDELKDFQRMELESLVLQVKNEIIESFKADSVDLKTTLQLEVASVRDLVINQTKGHSEENLINQQSDAMIKQLEEKCEIKRLIEATVQSVGANRQAVDEKLKNLKEGIQNLTLAQAKNTPSNNSDHNELVGQLKDIMAIVEAIKNDRDARSEKLITKLMDKIGRLLTAKLKTRTTFCELTRSTKTTLATIKAATDTLVETATKSDEENKLEKKFKELLTELNVNTTIGFDGVNRKLNTITNKANSFGKSCREIKSSIQGTLATELGKFSGKQVKSIKTAIGDVLANVSKSEIPKSEEKDEDGKSVEMSKLEAIEILVEGAKEKVKIELGKIEGRILKAFNETIVDRLVADGKGCIEARSLAGKDDKEHTGGNDMEHTGDDTEHTGDDTEHTGGDDTEHTGDDTEHTGDDTEHTGDDTEHAGDDTEDTGGDDTEHTGDDTEHTGDDTEHTGDDTEHTGDDTEDTGGDDMEHTGDDTEHTGDDTEDTGGDDTEHTGDDTEHTGDDTEHTGDDTEHTGDDTEDTGGDDTEHTGDDTEHTGGDDTENS